MPVRKDHMCASGLVLDRLFIIINYYYYYYLLSVIIATFYYYLLLISIIMLEYRVFVTVKLSYVNIPISSFLYSCSSQFLA